MSDHDDTTFVEIRDIPGFPGYLVSSDGNVYSRWSRGKGHPLTSTIQGQLRPYLTGAKANPCRFRYYCVGLIRDRKRHMIPVHNLVLLAFVGPRPDGCQGCHNNGDAHDNRLENLRWASLKENAQDKIRHGTVPCGEKSVCAKLTEEQVLEIRHLAAEDFRPIDLARRFKISLSAIRSIIARRSWKYLECSP